MNKRGRSRCEAEVRVGGEERFEVKRYGIGWGRGGGRLVKCRIYEERDWGGVELRVISQVGAAEGMGV